MQSIIKTHLGSRTLADLLPRPRLLSQNAHNAVLIFAGSAIVALSAQIEIPLPLTPVPITGQTFGVLLVGTALGWKRAAISMLAYLLEGAAGLPVFAGGAAGIAKFAGPTAGYLFSFPLAAAVAGWLAERGWDRSPSRTFCAMLISSVPNLCVGMVFLSFYVGGLQRAFLMGVAPFILGDVIKASLASIALPTAWKFANNPKHKQ